MRAERSTPSGGLRPCTATGASPSCEAWVPLTSDLVAVDHDREVTLVPAVRRVVAAPGQVVGRGIEAADGGAGGGGSGRAQEEEAEGEDGVGDVDGTVVFGVGDLLRLANRRVGYGLREGKDGAIRLLEPAAHGPKAHTRSNVRECRPGRGLRRTDGVASAAHRDCGQRSNRILRRCSIQPQGHALRCCRLRSRTMCRRRLWC